jgi:tetratricopeptide (TPR) repeat protein
MEWAHGGARGTAWTQKPQPSTGVPGSGTLGGGDVFLKPRVVTKGGTVNRTIALVAVVWSAAVATADDKKADTKTAAEQLAALRQETKEAETKLYKTLDDLGEDKEAQKKAGELFQAHEKEQVKRYEAALELAKADPRSDVAFDALAWLLETPRTYYLPVGKPAMELMLEHHAENPKVGKTVLTLGRFGPQEGQASHKVAAELLKAVAEKNPDKTVRGQVAMVGAWKAKEAFEAAEYRKKKDTEELAVVAEKAFEAVAKEYGECKLLGRGEKQTLKEATEVELFELRNLRVGKTAPDIEGEDLDGVKFKLSEYRGKVVVLDFWGDW